MSSWFDEFNGTPEPGTPPPGSVNPPSSAPGTTNAPTSPRSSPADFIANYQATHPPNLPDLLAAMKSAGYNVAPYMYGSVPSGNEITLDGQKYKVLSGENTGSPSWYTAGTDDSGGGSFSSFGRSAPSVPYEKPAPFNYSDFSYGSFEKPDPSKIAEDPGYQFRLDEGERALEASASARGTLRTGGTLKDITKFGQDYATSEYDKIYGRAFNEFQTGYENALGQYNANRANAYGNYVLNTQTGQWEWQANYGMGQDEIKNLLSFSDIGQRAAAGTPAPTPSSTLISSTPGATGTATGTQPTAPAGGTFSSFGQPSPNVSEYAPSTYAAPTRLSDLYRPGARAYA